MSEEEKKFLRDVKTIFDSVELTVKELASATSPEERRELRARLRSYFDEELPELGKRIP